MKKIHSFALTCLFMLVALTANAAVNVTADPADGSECKSLKEVLLTFNDATMVDLNSACTESVTINDAVCTLDYGAADNQILVNFTEVTENGDYTISFPAGALLIDDNESEAFELHYTIDSGALDPNVVLEPADGSTVGYLSSLLYSYKGVTASITAVYPYKEVTVKDADGNVVTTGAYAYKSGVPTGKANISLKAVVSTPGTYTVEIPDATFQYYSGGNIPLPGAIATYTVTGEGLDVVDVTPAEPVTKVDNIAITFKNEETVKVVTTAYNYVQILPEGQTTAAGGFNTNQGTAEGNTVTWKLNSPIVKVGKYTAMIPEGSFLVGEDEHPSSPISIAFEVKEPDPVACITVPAGSCKTLQKLVVCFPDKETISGNTNNAVTVTNRSISFSGGAYPSNNAYTIDGNKVECLLNNVATVAGKYEIKIPVNTFTFSDGTFNTEYIDSIEVTGSDDVTITVQPEAGSSVAKLQEFTLTFPDATSVEMTKGLSAGDIKLCPAGTTVATTSAYLHGTGAGTFEQVADNAWKVTMPMALVLAGEYDLIVGANAFTIDGDNYNKETTFRFSADGSGLDKITVTPTMAKPIKQMVGEIVITYDNETSVTGATSYTSCSINKDNGTAYGQNILSFNSYNENLIFEGNKVILKLQKKVVVSGVQEIQPVDITEAGKYFIKLGTGTGNATGIFLLSDGTTLATPQVLTWEVDPEAVDFNYTANPAEGAWRKLSQIALTFDDAAMVDINSACTEPVTINGAECTLDFGSADNQIIVNFTEVTEPGNCPVAFPAGALLLDNEESPAFTLHYSIDKNAPDPNVVLEPADGSTIGYLSSLLYSYKGVSVNINAVYPYKEVVVKDADGNVVTTGAYAYKSGVPTGKANISLKTVVATPGKYTVVVRDSTFQYYSGGNIPLPGAIATYTVTGEGLDEVDVTPGEPVTKVDNIAITFKNEETVKVVTTAYNYVQILPEGQTTAAGGFNTNQGTAEGNTVTWKLNSPIVKVGKYTAMIPEGSFLVGEDEHPSSPISIAFEVKEPDPVACITVPAGSCKTLQKLVVCFPDKEAISGNNNNAVTVTNRSISFSGGAYPSNNAYTIDGNKVECLLNNVATVAGKYEIKIPVNTFTFSDGTFNTEYIDSIEVTGSDDVTITVDPEAGSAVAKLQEFTFSFPDATSVEMTKGLAAGDIKLCPAGTTVATTSAYLHGAGAGTFEQVADNAWKVTMPMALVLAGEYDLIVGANAFTVDGDNYNKDTTFRFSADGSGLDKITVTPTMAKPIKQMVGEIVITYDNETAVYPATTYTSCSLNKDNDTAYGQNILSFNSYNENLVFEGNKVILKLQKKVVVSGVQEIQPVDITEAGRYFINLGTGSGNATGIFLLSDSTTVATPQKLAWNVDPDIVTCEITPSGSCKTLRKIVVTFPEKDAVESYNDNPISLTCDEIGFSAVADPSNGAFTIKGNSVECMFDDIAFEPGTYDIFVPANTFVFSDGTSNTEYADSIIVTGLTDVKITVSPEDYSICAKLQEFTITFPDATSVEPTLGIEGGEIKLCDETGTVLTSAYTHGNGAGAFEKVADNAWKVTMPTSVTLPGEYELCIDAFTFTVDGDNYNQEAAFTYFTDGSGLDKITVNPDMETVQHDLSGEIVITYVDETALTLVDRSILVDLWYDTEDESCTVMQFSEPNGNLVIEGNKVILKLQRPAEGGTTEDVVLDQKGIYSLNLGTGLGYSQGMFYLSDGKTLASPQYLVWMVDPGTTGLDGVSVDTVDDTIYNVTGQRVSENYRGYVIRSGKKILQR